MQHGLLPFGYFPSLLASSLRRTDARRADEAAPVNILLLISLRYSLPAYAALMRGGLTKRLRSMTFGFKAVREGEGDVAVEEFPAVFLATVGTDLGVVR